MPNTPDIGARFVPRAWAFDDQQPIGPDRLRRAGPRGRGRRGPRGVVLAAIDGGRTTRPVLAVARQVAELLDDTVQAVPADPAGNVAPQSRYATAAPALSTRGGLAKRLAESCQDADVDAVVMGTWAQDGDLRELDTAAAWFATAIDKPLVVVPPDAEPTGVIRRLLVPLEGTPATSAAAQRLAEPALRAGRQVTAVHITPQDAPDPPPRRTGADRDRAAGFMARYCPWGRREVELITKSGRPDALIPDIAWDRHSDLVVLGWSRRLSAGRAPVVRAFLEYPLAPVALVPIPAARRHSRPGTHG